MANKARQPISEQRRRVFLETLAATGSMTAAAQAASPHAQGERGAYESFRDLVRRDPQFAADVAEAKAAALGRVEKVIADHALNGVRRPIYQRGELVGHEQVFDHKLLLALAARLDPEWSERRRTELAGSVGVHRDDDSFLSISAADVLLLSEPEREMLVTLVQKIGELKAPEDGREIQSLPEQPGGD